MKARLYLLAQPGPQVFLIGSDDVQKKYKVIIGSQTCSCNKQNCVHLVCRWVVAPSVPDVHSCS